MPEGGLSHPSVSVHILYHQQEYKYELLFNNNQKHTYKLEHSKLDIEVTER